MGDQHTPLRKPQAPVQAKPALDPQNAQSQGQNLKTPPPFQMQAGPVQRQAAPTVTKTPEEIADKKAKLEANPGIYIGDNMPKVTDHAVVNAALENEGYKTIAKMDETTDLCGVNIAGGFNPLCLPKIKKVNDAFKLLETSTDPAKKEQATQIKAMIQKIGGANFRVQKKNYYDLDDKLKAYGLVGYRMVKLSDHALGCAVDVNANTITSQNAHFDNNIPGKKNDVLQFVEKVVKTTDATFDLDKTKGVDQMNRLNKFSDNFPTYIKELVADVEPDLVINDIWTDEAAILKVLKKVLSDEDAALKKAKRKKSKVRSETKLIVDSWETFKGWERGTTSKLFDEDKDHKVLAAGTPTNYGEAGKLNLKGIVDINATFVQMMIDAKWTWGGDFGRGNKDFMHFQDNDAMHQMKK